MLQLKKKIESVMHEQDSPPDFFLAAALSMAAVFYGAGQKLREFCYRQKVLSSLRLPCKVVCVGNITVGGTGKTPMAMYVARVIKQAGYRVAVISRGYKGGAESSGGVVSNGQSIFMGPEQAGDEPYMMACRLKDIPVIVGKNRHAAGMLALTNFEPDVIVLDDGFQHLRLQRDLDLVLLDHSDPFGNAHLLPRGILREPISSVARAAACILTRCRANADSAGTAALDSIKKHMPQGRVFTSLHVPYFYRIARGARIACEPVADIFSAEDIGEPEHTKIFGFSGIARNQDFQKTVKELGFKVAGFLEFQDHHRYSQEDLKAILTAAENSGARCLVTTEKDSVRIPPHSPLPLDLLIVGVRVSFSAGEKGFISFLLDRLQLESRAHSPSSVGRR
jgi:tetraacyldisaccharide 4'-kinase